MKRFERKKWSNPKVPSTVLQVFIIQTMVPYSAYSQHIMLISDRVPTRQHKPEKIYYNIVNAKKAVVPICQIDVCE